jgi:hypothetical protein
VVLLLLPSVVLCCYAGGQAVAVGAQGAQGRIRSGGWCAGGARTHSQCVDSTVQAASCNVQASGTSVPPNIHSSGCRQEMRAARVGSSAVQRLKGLSGRTISTRGQLVLLFSTAGTV